MNLNHHKRERRRLGLMGVRGIRCALCDGIYTQKKFEKLEREDYYIKGKVFMCPGCFTQISIMPVDEQYKMWLEVTRK